MMDTTLAMATTGMNHLSPESAIAQSTRAYVKDMKKQSWIKCNDSVVSVVDEKKVLEDARGGADQSSAAYFLIYSQQ